MVIKIYLLIYNFQSICIPVIWDVNFTKPIIFDIFIGSSTAKLYTNNNTFTNQYSLWQLYVELIRFACLILNYNLFC